MPWQAGRLAALAYACALPVLWAGAMFDAVALIVFAATAASSLPDWFVPVGILPWLTAAGIVTLVAMVSAESDAQVAADSTVPRIARAANAQASWTETWSRYALGREYGSSLRYLRRSMR